MNKYYYKGKEVFIMQTLELTFLVWYSNDSNQSLFSVLESELEIKKVTNKK